MAHQEDTNEVIRPVKKVARRKRSDRGKSATTFGLRLPLDCVTSTDRDVTQYGEDAVRLLLKITFSVAVHPLQVTQRACVHANVPVLCQPIRTEKRHSQPIGVTTPRRGGDAKFRFMCPGTPELFPFVFLGSLSLFLNLRSPPFSLLASSWLLAA